MLASSLWSYPQVTVAKKPAHRGEHEVSRKAIAQGMSECFRCPVCSCAPNAQFGTRDRGCSAHPAFPAPSIFEGGKEFASLGRNRVARSRTHTLSPRRPGERRDPYAAADIIMVRWSTALFQQLPLGVMGPGLRRGDGEGRFVGWAKRP